MKILYLHQYYKTPEEGGAIRSYHIAKALAEHGFEVDVITTSVYKRYVYKENNINVYYLHINYNNNFSFLKRLWAFVKYIVLSIIVVFKLKKHQCIYATSTPLTVAIPCLIISYFKSIPFVFEVRDLWPGVPAAIGILKNKYLLKLLFKLEYFTYLKSSKIIVLSIAMKEDIIMRYPLFKDKIIVVPNFSDNDNSQFETKPALHIFPIKIIYTGTLGFANEVSQLIELAKIANNSFKDLFKFSIIGEGSELQLLKNNATKNVEFLPTLDKIKVLQQIHSSDFVYVSYKKKVPLLYTGSPNKFFDALSVGTPVIINFDGWIYNVLAQNDLLLYHNTNSTKQLLQSLVSIYKSDELYESYSQKSKLLATSMFDKNKATNMIIQILNNINT